MIYLIKKNKIKPIVYSIGLILFSLNSFAKDIKSVENIKVNELNSSINNNLFQDRTVDEPIKDIENSSDIVGGKKETISVDIDNKENVPIAWLDVCINELSLCLSGITSFRENEIWYLELSDESINRLMINKEDFEFINKDGVDLFVVKNYEYISSELKLNLQIDVSSIKEQDLNRKIIEEKPADIENPFGMSINYIFSTSGENYSLTNDVIIGKKHWFYKTNFDYNGDELNQGNQALYYNDLKRELLWSFGDVTTIAGDALGSGGLMQGFSVMKDFSQKPRFIKNVRHDINGIIPVAGTLEVYNNNILSSTHQVRAGAFSLNDLNLNQGRQNIKLVLKDNTGQSINIASQHFYSSSILLDPSVYDYGFSIGNYDRVQKIYIGDDFIEDKIENEINNDDFYSLDKKMTVAQGYWKTGLNDYVTLGLRTEYAKEVQNYGINIAATSFLGDLVLNYGQSSEGGKSLSTNYSYFNKYLSFNWNHLKNDIDYKNHTNYYSIDNRNVIKRSDMYNLTFPIKNFNLNFNYSENEYFGRPNRKYFSTSLRGNINDIQWGLIYNQVEEEITTKKDKTISLNLSYSFDKVHSSYSFENTDLGNAQTLSLSGKSNNKIGWNNYSLTANDHVNGDKTYNATAGYKTNYGYFNFVANQNKGDINYNGTFRGSLVLTREDFLFGPPLSNAYAIIDAGGAPNSPIINNNSNFGQTNNNGKAIIPDLTAYYPSSVGFDKDKLDINVDIGNDLTKKIVVLPSNPNKVRFEASRAMAAQFILKWPNGVPFKYGIAEFDESIKRKVDIGKNGMLWLDGLEDIPNGEYKATLRNEKGVAECIIPINDLEVGINFGDDVTCKLISGTGDLTEEEFKKEQEKNEAERERKIKVSNDQIKFFKNELERAKNYKGDN